MWWCGTNLICFSFASIKKLAETFQDAQWWNNQVIWKTWKIRMTANEIFSLKQDSPSFCRTQMSLVQLSTVGEADFTWRIKRAKEPNQPMRFSRCMTKDCNQPCTSDERRWKLPDMLQETAQSINKSDDDRNLSTLPLAGTTSISCRCHYALEQWELYHGHDNWQSNNLDWIKQGTWNPRCNIWFFNLVARIKTNTKDTLLPSCSSNLNKSMWKIE